MKTDKISISNEKLNIFAICAKQYLLDAPESELKMAVDDLIEPAIKRLKKYERGAEIIRVKHCKKTNSKHIEKDKSGNYQYTEEDYKKLLEDLDALSESEIDFPSNIVRVDNIPSEGLTPDIRRAFEGIVIPKKVRKFDNDEEDEEATEPIEDKD